MSGIKGEFELYTEPEAFFNCAFLSALANGITIIHEVKAAPKFAEFADYLRSIGANVNIKENNWEICGVNFKCNKPLGLSWIGDSLPWQKRNKRIIESLLEGSRFHCEERIAVNDSLIRELASFGAEIEWRQDGPDETDEFAKRMARAQGIKNERKWICNITPARSLLARDRFIAGSVSEAAYLALAASIIPDSDIVIKAVCLDSSRAGIFSAFKRLGASIEIEARHERGNDVWGNLRVKSAQGLIGRKFGPDMLSACVEEIPMLAALAAVSESETILSLPSWAASSCKDILENLYENFKSAGVECGFYEEGLILRGASEIDPQNFDCRGNVNLGLALHALNKKAKGKGEIIGIECVEKEYPGVLGLIENLRMEN
jgi:5-enolpyruvylshikimate-3-phosphate synthase